MHSGVRGIGNNGDELRYDAAIIGAGADGLAAAATLAKSGFKTIVLERAEQPGGRCITREFYPGFRVSPFCDEIAAIPPEIFWSLDLARRGAVFVPTPHSTALWSDRASILRRHDPFSASCTNLAHDVLRRAQCDAEPKPKSRPLIRRPSRQIPWPGQEWTTLSLDEVLARNISDTDTAVHITARTLSGRAAHPALAGSALHLLALAGGETGQIAGGLPQLTAALTSAAQDFGAEIVCGLEVTDIRRQSGKVSGVRLADGTEIDTPVVLSTLDLKRTFLSLFAWNELPAELASRVAGFRMAGSTARLLFALDGLPQMPSSDGAMFRGPLYIAPDAAIFAGAFTAWRAGTIPEKPPVTLRFPSVTNFACCPPGAAVMTATVGCVPVRLFDGSWTHEKRDVLRDSVLGVCESVLPGISGRVLAVETIVPPDIEESLGLTDGDLWGGEIAADQMMDLRPGLGGPRTSLHGVYLAGPSSAAGPLGTCASGVIAASAIAADLRTGRLK